MLVKAAIVGSLSTRADATKHNGDFRKIVEGVNQTLDAVIGPLNDFAHVLDALASGDLTVTAEKQYAGDFEEFKKSVNTLGIQVRQAMQQIGRNTAALVASSEELNKAQPADECERGRDGGAGECGFCGSRTGQQECSDGGDGRRRDGRKHQGDREEYRRGHAVCDRGREDGGNDQRRRSRSLAKAARRSDR